MQLERLPAVCRDGLKRIVVDFGAGDDRDLIVEQLSELANDPALACPRSPSRMMLCLARIALTSWGMTVSS